jgi:hypothetical protein
LGGPNLPALRRIQVRTRRGRHSYAPRFDYGPTRVLHTSRISVTPPQSRHHTMAAVEVASPPPATDAESISGVSLKGLSYAYPGCAPSIENVNLELPRGSRCLLIGANGAGERLGIGVVNSSVARGMLSCAGRAGAWAGALRCTQVLPPPAGHMSAGRAPASAAVLAGRRGYPTLHDAQSAAPHALTRTRPPGKTTLLQLLAGKYMVGREVVTVLGRSPFYDLVRGSQRAAAKAAVAWARGRGKLALAVAGVPSDVTRTAQAASMARAASPQAAPARSSRHHPAPACPAPPLPATHMQRAAELPGHVLAQGRRVCRVRRSSAGAAQGLRGGGGGGGGACPRSTGPGAAHCRPTTKQWGGARVDQLRAAGAGQAAASPGARTAMRSPRCRPWPRPISPVLPPYRKLQSHPNPFTSQPPRPSPTTPPSPGRHHSGQDDLWR